jgi:hypothetical protein
MTVRIVEVDRKVCISKKKKLRARLWSRKTACRLCFPPTTHDIAAWQTGKCAQCYLSGVGDCTKAALVCTQGYITSCGANASAYNLSESFRARRDSCIMGGPDLGFWTHPSYVIRGDYVDVGIPRGGLLSATLCAQYCTSVEGCTAFTYDTIDLTCRLKTGNFRDVCDPATQAGCTDSGLPVFVLDKQGMYCRKISQDCACSREFYYCMKSKGCATGKDAEELAKYADMCIGAGCSAEQCGLPPSPSVGTVTSCTNEYFECADKQVHSSVPFVPIGSR